MYQTVTYRVKCLLSTTYSGTKIALDDRKMFGTRLAYIEVTDTPPPKRPDARKRRADSDRPGS